ncbi:uncharacterized protein CCR75_007935 [Bremia lactucae]|uniref:Uncharacterized protein n=1 Tax=Bremia lactucae TaxID=4779 RepID=A0A976IJ28_BRELC|nr:hypothetical protein CCR75_007935 [Bremia lactucae]
MQRIADEFRAASEHCQIVLLDHFTAVPDADSIILSECKAVGGLVARRQLAVSFLNLNIPKTPCFHVEDAGIAAKWATIPGPVHKEGLHPQCNHCT